MPQLNKVNLTFTVTAPRVDLLDDTATQIALDALNGEYTIKSMDFKDIHGHVVQGTRTWTTEVTVVADHI